MEVEEDVQLPLPPAIARREHRRRVPPIVIVRQLTDRVQRLAKRRRLGCHSTRYDPTPKAGTRTQCVLYVGPWGQAALRPRYVRYAGGWYA